jgi:hypothetical protein
MKFDTEEEDYEEVQDFYNNDGDFQSQLNEYYMDECSDDNNNF